VAYLHQGLATMGWRSTILCREPSVFEKESDVGVIEWNGLADVLGFWRFVKACRDLQPDVLHCHDSHAFTVGTCLGAVTGTPVVMTRRVLFPLRVHALNRWKYRRVARLIAISTAVEQALRAIARGKPIHVVADAVEGMPITRDERRAARTRLALDEDRIVIGCVGHFTAEKNAALLMDAAQHLSQTRQNVMIVCVGPLDEEIGQRARTLPNVLATGFVANPLDLYAAFDLYVSTSQLEGLGSALLDAVVRDIPAIAVDSGGVRDIFGERPRLASPGDRYDFIRLLEQTLDALDATRDDSRILGAEARARFNLQTMVQGNMDVYLRVPQPVRR
jgi:glycosyltransferase involved in cell wall biosynthesis